MPEAAACFVHTQFESSEYFMQFKTFDTEQEM